LAVGWFITFVVISPSLKVQFSWNLTQSINIFNGRLKAHAQQHDTIQLKTITIKKEYSANVLELVKEHTSPMPMRR